SAGTLNWAVGATDTLNVTSVSSSVAASSLNMTNGGTLIIRGTWTTTNLAFTAGTGTIDIRSTMTLPVAYATYNNLSVGTGGTVTLGVATTFTGNVSIATGNLITNNLNMTVGGNWTKSSTTTFTPGTGTVTFDGSGSQS